MNCLRRQLSAGLIHAETDAGTAETHFIRRFCMLISLLQKRRSIRKFQPREVEDEKIDTLLEAALRSPSSRAIYPWEFVVVTDKNILEKLSQSKKIGSAFLANAPLAIVICADQKKSDVWIEDASIASIIIHLTAASLGLGSCWVQIRKRMHNQTESSERYIADILKLPADLKILSIIGVGYPAEQKPPHEKEKLQYSKIHHEVYGGK